MPSIYQNKVFAEFWNKRAGDKGEPYKRYVLDPIMLKLAGSLKNKDILELGCGNGYLATTFLRHSPRKIVLADISKHNLAFASEKVSDSRIHFQQLDATKQWRNASSSLDIIYSNMMLNEVKNIKTPIQEAYRCLRKGGQFIFSVTHPAWDLFVHAQELAGKSSAKIQGLGSYFHRGFASFMMGGDDKSNAHLGEPHHHEFAVEHFHRPISDYFDAVIGAGFTVAKMVEPPVNKTLLKQFPRFAKYSPHPIGLIFHCKKI